MNTLKNKIRKKILDIGFDSVGFTKPIIDLKTSRKFKEFLNKNHHGEMRWLERHYEKKRNPKKIWEDVKTVIVVGLNYAPTNNPLRVNNFKEKANISVYAKNKDYHIVIKNKLKEFKDWFNEEFKLDCKIFVDTAPVMEKYFAKKTGVGWQGKHTNIVSKKFGSWLFLSEIFLSIDIDGDKPSKDNCGSCDDCLKICPTNALYEESKIDARKCISYLTIEYKGPIPIGLREKIGNKVYGCDDCLSVCPWNKFSEPTKNKNFLALEKEKDLKFFLDFDEKIFKKYFFQSPILRIGWISFIRNILIASGNSKIQNLSPSIKKYLTHKEPLVRGTAVWSINRLHNFKHTKLFQKLKTIEKNEYVKFELNYLD